MLLLLLGLWMHDDDDDDDDVIGMLQAQTTLARTEEKNGPNKKT